MRLVAFYAFTAVALAACDPRASKYKALEESVFETQIAARVCPAGSYGYAKNSMQELAIGPYRLRYPANFLQIDAYRIHRRGDMELVAGERKPMPVARAWVQIHALAPEMRPRFLELNEVREREQRGDLYLVDIELFWSEDGSRRPEDGERIGNLTGEESPMSESLTPIGLRAIELPPWGVSRRVRLVPVTALENGPSKIMCSGFVDGGGRGSCSVVKRLRHDVWVRYSYASPNVACWREVDQGVSSLLADFTSDWKVYAP